MSNNHALAGPLGFTDEHSFGLFMESLRSLQGYEDEAAKGHPTKAELNRTMQSALICLRECASRYSQDLLPIFYLGVALSMKNQEVFVDRLVELTPALLTWGKCLAFEDMNLDPGIAGKAFPQKRAGEERQLAQPFLALGKRPWPLLEEAARLFEMLTIDPALSHLARVAGYNLAQVWARRGSGVELSYLIGALGETISQDPKDDEALPDIKKLLQDVKLREAEYNQIYQQPDSFVDRISSRKREQRRLALDRARRAIHSGYENVALTLQFDTLRRSLNLRLAGAEASPEALNRLPDAIQSAVAVGRLIRETELLDPGFKADLMADYLTKIGYAKYEFASNRVLHAFLAPHADLLTALNLPPAQTPSARLFLDSAAEDFTLALELKEHWNPAQIYLALVRRIQAGTAQARTDFIQYDKSQALALNTQKKKDIEQRLQEITALESLVQLTDMPKRLALSQENTSKLKELASVTAELEDQGADFDRRIADSQREEARFSGEADELFAALQGCTPAPPKPGAPAATTPTPESN